MDLFLLPSRNIVVTIPLVLAVGFVTGLLMDTSVLKNYLLWVTILMIYPTMIGYKVNEVINFNHTRLLLAASVINFVLVPVLAYILGIVFLLKDPQLFAGLAIASLLPTSNMTIAFTHFARGNIPAAIKLTVISLVLGSIAVPWYLLVMVGSYICIDIFAVLKTVAMVIFLPLVMGFATYSLLLKKYTREEFNKSVKPLLPATTAWGMVYMMFTGISANAQMIVSQPGLLFIAIIVWMVFYFLNYLMAVKIGRWYFCREDALTLVFGTVLRNLAISIGLAATAFGVTAAFMVSLAFLFQGQSAAWFIRINEKYKILPEENPVSTQGKCN
ncbi:Sodium Bile acid symporter family protein [Pelotomaculum sp. FP]|nr:Sodium Bile acid symporter family protein [Pelotomaculum sp. FP]